MYQTLFLPKMLKLVISNGKKNGGLTKTCLNCKRRIEKREGLQYVRRSLRFINNKRLHIHSKNSKMKNITLMKKHLISYNKRNTLPT